MLLDSLLNRTGSCGIPVSEKCCVCGTPCTDSDLVGNSYMCTECLNKDLDEYEAQQKPTKGTAEMSFDVLYETFLEVWAKTQGDTDDRDKAALRAVLASWKEESMR